MALTEDDFKHLPTSLIIPEDRLPASEFAVAFQFSFTARASGNTFNKPFKAHLRLQVLTAAGEVKYEIDIQETYNVIIIPLAPGLVWYLWTWAQGLEQIGGTVGVAGPPMKTLGKANLNSDPDTGEGISTGEAIVASRFFSYIFTEPLEAGDRFKIVHHDVSDGPVIDQASLTLATEIGEASPGLHDSRCGQQFRVVTDGGKVRVLRSRHNTSPLAQDKAEWGDFGDDARGVVTPTALQNMSLARGPGDALFLLGRAAGRIQLQRTFDEGEHWEQLMSTPSGVTPLASCLSQDGSTFFIYGLGADSKPAYLILKNQSGGWEESESGACEGDGLPTTGVNALQISSGGLLRLLATQSAGGKSGLLFFTSGDGKSYTEEKVQ